MKPLIKQLTEIANKLGYAKGLKSYDKLYQSAINTFGYAGNSMWTLTISINLNNDIVGIEINTTYWDKTESVNKINNACSFSNPLTPEQVLQLL